MTLRRTFLQKSTTGLLFSPMISSYASSEHDRITIAQIGTEHAHAEGKLSTILQLTDHFKLAGVVAESESHRQKAIQHKTYQSVEWISEEEVLQNPNIQAVAVETLVSQLVPTALRCVKAGKNIHLDKPAGESLEDFKQVVSIAKENQLQIQMGYMYRYNPAFQFCYHAVQQGWLGEIFAIHAVMSKKSGDDKRVAIAEYSGGTMFELGCHVIDSIIYLLGKPASIKSVHKQTYRQKDSLKDNQLAVFEYPTAIATVRASLIEPFGFEQRQFVVNGTEGTIEIQPLEPPLLKISSNINPKYRGSLKEAELKASTGRYHAEIIDFAQTVREEKKSDFTYQHDLDTHDFILKASGYK